MSKSQPGKSNRIEKGFVPGPFTGVRGWARYHRKARTPPTKIKGDPTRYLHSSARTRQIKAVREFIEHEWNHPHG